MLLDSRKPGYAPAELLTFAGVPHRDVEDLTYRSRHENHPAQDAAPAERPGAHARSGRRAGPRRGPVEIHSVAGLACDVHVPLHAEIRGVDTATTWPSAAETIATICSAD